MKNTAIAWADSTWNPWWGCTKVSPGCDHCYANAFAKRTGKNCWGPNAARQTMGKSYWAEPLKWDAAAARGKVGKDGKHWIVFAGDMCDVFDAKGLDGERKRMWELIRKTPHLIWLLLTKRPENFRKFLPADWGDGYPNVWLGVTVEDRKHGFRRVDILRRTPAAVRFLSCEPLLEDVSDVDLTDIDWVIVGGESGPGSRSFDLEWARKLRISCAEAHTVFFFKQLGSKPIVGSSPFPILNNQANGKRDLHGKAPANFPPDLQVQEWPNQDLPLQADAGGLSPEACTQVLKWLNDYAQAPDIGVLGHLAQSAYASLTGMLQVFADLSATVPTTKSSS
jgi:protein gp37